MPRQYTTKSMLPETDGFITWPDNQVNTTFRNLGNAQTLDTLRQALPGEITKNAVIPNMLMPAYRLERQLRCDNQADAQAVLNETVVKDWLRVLCAVLFNDDNHLKCYDVNLDAPTSMHLRILKKTLVENGYANPTFRLFVQRTGPGDEDFEPIAFTYSGLRIAVCPVVELNRNNFAGVHNDPQGWLNCADPIQHLRKAGNEAYCARLIDYLAYNAVGVGQHTYGVFEQEYSILCNEICNQLGPVNGVQSAFFPRRIKDNFAGRVDYSHWFTDYILCVKCDQIGEGLLTVAGKEYKCILPVKKECIDNGASIQSIRDSASVVADGKDLIVSFEWDNTLNQKRYTENKIVRFDVNQQNYLGNVMVWPNKVCAEWNRYFSYLSVNAAVPSMCAISMEVFADGVWEAAADARILQTGTPGATFDSVRDYVIETNSLPDAISLKYGATEIGMFVIDRVSLPPVHVGNIGQMGVDFGTTNTIAYFRLNNDLPQCITISENRKILFKDSETQSDSNQMLPFLFAPGEEAGNQVPFKTAVQRFDGAVSKAYENTIAPLQYRKDMSRAHLESLTIIDRLKWPENLANVKPESIAFLEYMMLLWLWEIRKKERNLPDNYVFTYPGALPEVYVQGLFTTVMDRMPDAFVNPRRTYKYVTEAAVVIQFYSDDRMMNEYTNLGYNMVNPHAGYLLMDIGGGSVDVSLWQKQNNDEALYAEFSLADFAGNDILQKQVFAEGNGPRMDLLAQILGGNDTDLSRANNDSAAAKFYQGVKNIGNNEDEFRQQWNMFIDTVRETMSVRQADAAFAKRKMYRKSIEMYFHFMFFLSGFVYGNALNDGRIHPLEDTYFAVMLGGNGSRMYDLCGDNAHDFDVMNVKMFANGMRYAEATIPHNMGVIVVPSIRHKHEVAFGASKYENAPVTARAINHAIALDGLAEDAAPVNVIPEWLDTKQHVIRQQEGREFFDAYLDALGNLLGANGDYLNAHFQFDLPRQGFYQNANARVTNGSLAKAVAEIFRTLLHTLGAQKY